MIAVGLVCITALFLLIFLQVPVGAALAAVGFAGLIYLSGLGSALGVLSTSIYSSLSTYSMSVIPLFVLMGYFAFYAGLSQALYRAANLWLGWLRGGLAMGTVVGCAGFAACSGSSVATGATMTAVALPEMRRFGYHDGLITGCLAAGGTIGILIPPSICFIIYGIITEQSIGKLFMAGIIPGIMEVVLYLLTIAILCRLNPEIAPQTPRNTITLRHKLKALGDVWAVLLLFILVIGGIYGGIFTPSEAGAIGAFGAFVLMLTNKKLTRANFIGALFETGQTTAMVFFIFVGATIFGYLLAVSRLPMEMAAWTATLLLNRYIILAGILLVFIALGCIMDTLAIIMLIVPIIFPVILKMQFDPIWFGVIMVRISEIGLITPPVGLNAYVIKGMAPDVPLATIFKGIVPFLLADFASLILLIAFPQISLFLPSLMK
ncbi:TRAP transporter large permease [Thermodesulfobacteriota bacterium]